jgi:hypothetical protein
MSTPVVSWSLWGVGDPFLAQYFRVGSTKERFC